MYDNYSMGKCCYKSLPMGVANLPEILQQKMNDLFHRFEFISAYIDYILIVKKETGQIMYRG